MKRILILAVAASLAGCHSRNEDQAGAAPVRGDTTAVTHQVDPERTGPPGTAGRPGASTITPDSVGLDSARVVDSTHVRPDTAAGGTEMSPSSVPQDTLGPHDQRSSGVTGWSDSTARDTSAAH